MMRVDIENMLRQISDRVRSAPYGYTYMLESLTKNLRELRDRTQSGDMAALDEFFGFYIFSDHKEYKRGAAPEPTADGALKELRQRLGLETGRDEWLIRKRGFYYRPNRAGYTSSIAEAGRYTEAEAKAEAAIEPASIQAIELTQAMIDAATPNRLT
jgi:hypothetical protein